MDEFIAELKKQVLFKDTTASGDIVLLASDEPRMAIYALVTGIEPDPGRKSWWNVSMQVLTIPPRETVWTLREPQFTGMEPFTFSGVAHFMKAVQFEQMTSSSAAGKKDAKRPDISKSRLRVIK